MDRPPGSRLAPRSAPRLAPRLVIVFAVLACVFGWGHSASLAAPAEPVPTPAVVDAPQVHHVNAGHAGHAGHDDASPEGRQDDGHSDGHEHSVFCMASSAAPALGLVPAPDVTALLVTVVPPQSRHCATEGGLNEQRAPGIATLCVLRT